MHKKIVHFMIVGVLGIFILPNIVNATTTNFNVNINYKEEVLPTDFNLEYCSTFNASFSDCNTWTPIENSTGIGLSLVDDTSHGESISWLRISLANSSNNEFTIVYDTARTHDEVSNPPINTFKGDGDEPNATNFIFKFKNTDQIANNTYVFNIYPLLKSFGWNFAEEDGVVSDAGIENGTAELITDESVSGNILIEIGEGDYQILPGTVVTIQLLPNKGYQLTSLSIGADDAPLTAGNDTGYFSFTMPNHNLHFKSIFTSVADIIDKNSYTVSTANVSESTGLIEKGNLRLSIADIESTAVKERLNNSVEDGNVAAYLDLNLDNILLKGSYENVWSESLTDLGNKYVTITLELGNIELTEDSYIVYEHNGQFYTITADDVTYDGTASTITFNANKFSNYAVVTSAPLNSHTLEAGENDEFIITFEDMVNDEYELEVNSLLELLELTDEELIAAGEEITHEEIQNVFNGIKDDVSENEELVDLYEISVILNGNIKTDGPLTFKIKLTDELEQYNTYKMIYINDEFEATETIVTGTLEDGYIIFNLPHLSVYALTASNVGNPKTGDSIMNPIIFGSVSLIVLIGTSIYLKKKNKLNFSFFIYR